ncbi:MAG: RHS repeat-associated core domain-containing protein [Eubacteriales bacterium]
MHGRLRTEIEGSFTRNYIYGQDGIVGYEENGEHFTYRKNFFGDITAIYRGTTKVAEYTYDAWGNCTIVFDTNGYGSRNPFRYRGYYWDEDLKMYYLMTRYYDPKTGRFINADAIEYLKPDAINGLNLYAYCRNNPIRYVDPTGHEELTQDEISDFLCGAAIILWAVIMVVLGVACPDSSNSGTGKIWEDNYFDPNLDLKWIDPPPSLGPKSNTEKFSFIDFHVSICQAKLYFDAKRMHSLYIDLLSVSVFAGFDIDEDMYGLFVDIGVFNFGYDGRYLDIGVSGIGAGLGLGWQDGKLIAKYDSVGYWGVDASVDFGLMIKDLLQE